MTIYTAYFRCVLLDQRMQPTAVEPSFFPLAPANGRAPYGEEQGFRAAHIFWSGQPETLTP